MNKNVIHSIEIANLISAYLQSGEKTKELEKWISSSPNHKRIFDEIISNPASKLGFYEQINTKENWEELQKRRNKKPSIRLWQVLSGIAGLLLLLLAINYFLPQKLDTKKQTYQLFDGSKIMPGKTTATLTTNGKTIALNKSIQVKTAHGLTVIDSTGNSIYATPLSKQSNTINHLSIPRGGEYFIILEEGTKIWLNSDTELSFPEHFSSIKREITITGEAYLEVAKEKNRPFYVNVNQNRIHVTGTSFNVRNFSNEPLASISLITGKIKMERKDGTELAQISPLQQFNINKQSQQYYINKINPDDVLAWKNNLFVFDNEPLSSIACKLERWYNIDISVSPSIRENRYSGTLNKYKSIQSIINILRMTHELKFIKDKQGNMEIIPSNEK